jgi:hypothetical protein
MKGETWGPQAIVHKSILDAPQDPYWLEVWTDDSHAAY